MHKIDRKITFIKPSTRPIAQWDKDVYVQCFKFMRLKANDYNEKREQNKGESQIMVQRSSGLLIWSQPFSPCHQ